MADSAGEKRPLRQGEIVGQLRRLGIATGGALLVHSSHRAVRPVEGGPRGLIDALLNAIGPAGTLIMPSWTGDDMTPFDPAATPASSDLGVMADMLWRRPGAVRSAHPFAFAAIGPQAEEIVSVPFIAPPHAPGSPVDRVRALDGQVLLLGVGQDANTTLHLAELIAGVPYRVPKQITILRDGQPVHIEYGENDHCCARFALADDWLRAEGRMAEGPAGNAQARLARSQDIVDAAVARLRADPLLFLHAPDAGCEECDAARQSAGA